MISVDTNILFAACNAKVFQHTKAKDFLCSENNMVICELVLTELYTLLRNPAVMSQNPLQAAKAVEVIQSFRHHPRWRVVENAPVMDSLWKIAGRSQFPRRNIYDARIALTLRHHGVSEFATVKLSYFNEYGFDKVWNPLN